MQFFAHTLPDQPPEAWQTLADHLDGVARRAGQFASVFGAAEWGRAAGLLHDLGKYSEEFQRYIAGSYLGDSHSLEQRGRIDHTTAGAQYAVEALGGHGHLLAYVVSGHHSGLLDGRSEGACLEARLQKTQLPWWRHEKTVLPDLPQLEPPMQLKSRADLDCFTIAFFVRVLFSCLTDADFLDTEAFMDPARATERPVYPDDVVQILERCLREHMAQLSSSGSLVNRQRQNVLRQCVDAAEKAQGLFSLTVPTGGGKTLSSLAFALRHASIHGLRRVVYVIPFTSIIDQNAAVFREVFQPLVDEGLAEVVVEHHSNLDVGDESTASRLATENWDAPLVVTTSVQFYESLYANRTSKCRKLHNLANAVVILDEVQTLPVELLHPCLRALDELAQGYGSSIVLCTATQPAVHRRDDFPIGLKGVREIIADPASLYVQLQRTQVLDAGELTHSQLSERLLEEEQALCIVNTRREARGLFETIGTSDPHHYHLSALMCPAHRSQVLCEIRRRLDAGEPCRVISTQLVEAGVDLDFPVVYRALAGLDSIAQAAGRCNRNGTLGPGALGRVYVFRPDGEGSRGYFAETAGCGAQILELYRDNPLGLDAVEHYFRLYYWQREDSWDKKQILEAFRILRDNNLPFSFSFAEAAAAFRLIESPTKPVIVPWDGTASRLCDCLRKRFDRPGRDLLRHLQKYTVSVHKRQWSQHEARGDIELVSDRYPILVSAELLYSDTTGLCLDEEQQVFLDA